jgi:endonuclease-3
MRVQKTAQEHQRARVRILKLARAQIRDCDVPIVTLVAGRRSPYLVLISCILSLRTKDKTTVEACRRLFRKARTPRAMLALSPSALSRLIYPVGFYRTKAHAILALSRRIIAEFAGRVPDTQEELLRFKGVGRKTANLVLGLGFGIPALCVDTHVHRLSNRLGWVRTRTPEETEYALEKRIPRQWWIELNTILVTFGQNVCLPVSPLCSRCAVRRYCARAGVAQWR